jgi:hypothetical protein
MDDPLANSSRSVQGSELRSALGERTPLPLATADVDHAAVGVLWDHSCREESVGSDNKISVTQQRDRDHQPRRGLVEL